MSHVFYDRLIILEGLDELIKKKAKTPEEKEELWLLVDELIHHRVVGCVLENLPDKYHQEFLEKFTASPHDEGILDYLREKIENIEELIAREIKLLTKELFD